MSLLLVEWCENAELHSVIYYLEDFSHGSQSKERTFKNVSILKKICPKTDSLLPCHQAQHIYKEDNSMN